MARVSRTLLSGRAFFAVHAWATRGRVCRTFLELLLSPLNLVVSAVAGGFSGWLMTSPGIDACRHCDSATDAVHGHAAYAWHGEPAGEPVPIAANGLAR